MSVGAGCLFVCLSVCLAACPPRQSVSHVSLAGWPSDPSVCLFAWQFRLACPSVSSVVIAVYSVSPAVHLSGPSVRMPACLSGLLTRLASRQFESFSPDCLFIYLSVRPSGRPSIRTFARPFVRPLVHPSVLTADWCGDRASVRGLVCGSEAGEHATSPGGAISWVGAAATHCRLSVCAGQTARSAHAAVSSLCVCPGSERSEAMTSGPSDETTCGVIGHSSGVQRPCMTGSVITRPHRGV